MTNLKLIITFFFVAGFLSFTCTGQVNTFLNTENDEDWNNSVNWSLGIIPTALHDVTLTSGEGLKIKTGESGIARKITLTNTDTFIVQELANLIVVDQVIILGTGFFSNRGETTFNTGSSGFYITLGGSLTNQDTIIMNQPERGFDFRGGTIKNNGYINIINPLEEGILMYQAMDYPNQRHFYNNADGHILISAPNGFGVYLADSLTNNGLLEIINVIRNIPTAEANSMFVHALGRVFNYGHLTLQSSDDHGLVNEGIFKNYQSGFMEVTGFDNDGIINHFSFENMGDIEILGSVVYPQNAGIRILNTFQMRGGSSIYISGSYDLQFGIYNEYPITVDTNAYINIIRTKSDAIYDLGGINNHGLIEISQLLDTLSYGIACNTNFTNNGIIDMSEMGGGIYTGAGTFNNNGTMTFHNLISKAIFATSTFNNNVDGIITVTNSGGNRISWGIVYVDETVFNHYFTNAGNITIDSCHIGLWIRQGGFVNSGSILINHYRQAINFGGFSGIPNLYNEGNLIIRNHEEPLSYTIDLEEGDSGYYNLINYAAGIIDIKDAYRGFHIQSGLLNQGMIKMENITETCFFLENYDEYHDMRNDYGATIDIINTGRAVQLGYFPNSVNQIYFVNYGLFKFQLMTDTVIGGVNSMGTFENYGTMMGDGIIDCDFAKINSFYRPGQNIGVMNFANFETNLHPTYFIQLKGDAGFGVANGHDGIIINGIVNIEGTLNVATLPGFDPQEDDTYVVLVATDTLIGTFDSHSLPYLGNGLIFEVIYDSTSVILKIISLPRIWTGNCDSIWSNPCNWSGGIVPDSTHTVIISADVLFFPSLDSGSFSIGSGGGSQQCRRLILYQGSIIRIR
ncbi:MAG: hypothetical protein H7X99_09310, partial [Saprospiraceae bacterium]|nr:hypothetical protein [Saprospiraceae bacterium]